MVGTEGNAIKIPVIRVRQPIGDLYVGVLRGKDLYDIAKVDRLRLESLEIPKYAGFQRALVPQRVAAIRDYLRTPNSTLPNAIIMSLDSEHILNWQDFQDDATVTTLEIERVPEAATIIDGQHRAAALDAAPPELEVIVSIFVDLEMVEQAAIFAKINSTQKAVNPSIAFQLFGYAEGRSPQKTAHEIASTLDTTRGSPFYRMLRMLGTKDAWSAGTLSQSTFAKGIMRLYTRDYRSDENRLLRGEPPETYSGYPLREAFKKGDDGLILQVVWRFFFHVAQSWHDQWFDQSGESILTKTTGFNAFLEVLRSWLRLEGVESVLDDNLARARFDPIVQDFTHPNTRFIRMNYPAGHQGVVTLRDALLRELRLDEPT
ncbi:MAG: DGQHR domain-containing protein [Dehalococcoidia bacterium]|nr:DGQHR domain-containing protein [Dehalococcoidia bacterium]